MTDLLAARAAGSPAALALVDGVTGRRVSYAAFDAAVDRVAGALAAAGIGRGARVAILGETAIATLDAIFACGRLGALAVLVPWRLAPAELAPLVARAHPAVLLHDATHAALAAQVAGDVPRRDLATLDGAGGARPPRVALLGDDPWLVVYTGGSTGVPKGAVLTHGGVRANAEGTRAAWRLGADDLAVCDAPLYHTGGLNVLTTPLVAAGGASVLCPRSDPAQTLALLARERPTLLFGVPTMLQRLVEHPGAADADWRSVRLAVTGGAPAPPRLFARFAALGVPLRLGYGLSEAGPNHFSGGGGDDGPGAVGRPLPHVRLRLDAGGQLLVSGPHLMAGYLDDPAATAAAISADGWLATGDLAECTADGRFHIVGRKKDLYISGGENVFPAEIEAVLADHAAVAECAVVGVPHADWGETGLAVIVPRGPAPPAEAELRAFLRARLAGFKVPTRWRFVDELPRTPAGKVDRARLRGHDAPQKAPATPSPQAPAGAGASETP